MGLSAGRLRHRIDILDAVKVSNGKGGHTTTWTPIGVSVPAEVLGRTGGEALQERILQTVSVYQITTRWRGDVKPEQQIRHGEQLLNIKSAVDPTGRRQELIIIADTEAVAA